MKEINAQIMMQCCKIAVEMKRFYVDIGIDNDDGDLTEIIDDLYKMRIQRKEYRVQRQKFLSSKK